MARKIVRHILVVVFIAGAVCAALIVLALGSLGFLIRYAITTHGPAFLHTRVELGSCTVSPFSGMATLHDFVLGNPDGFSRPDAVRVKSLTVQLDWLSVLSNTLVIRALEIQQPNIHYEKKVGTDNFKVLLERFKTDAQENGTGVIPEKPSRPARSREKAGKKLLIHDLLISSGTVTMNLPQTGGRNLTVPLPTLHLTDLGAESGGASPAVIGQAILKSLYKEVTRAGIGETVDRVIGIAGAAAGNEAKKGVDKIKRALKSLWGK